MNIKDPYCFDIWEANTVTDWNAAKAWIIKASEGATIEDAGFADNWKESEGRTRMAYHFYRQAYTGGQNAKNFYNVVSSRGGLQKGDRVALDCEESGMSLGAIVDTIYNIQLLFRIQYDHIVLYSTASILNNLSDAKLTQDQKNILKQVVIWGAGYPYSPDDFSSPPAAYIPDQTRYGKMDVWQYAGDVNPSTLSAQGILGIMMDGQKLTAALNSGLGHAGMSLAESHLNISGISGGIDLNWLDLDYFNAWQAETQGAIPAPVPDPIPAPVPQPTPTPEPVPVDGNRVYLFGGKIAYDKIVDKLYTAHVMVVDMMTGAKMFFSPPNRNGYLNLMTPERFLHWQNLQLCMNGPDQFYWPKPKQKSLVYPSGLAAYQGNIYHKSTNEETLYVDQNNGCSFILPAGKIYNAASFPRKAVNNGMIVAAGDMQLKPRSAFGWTADGKQTIWIKVDGNEAQGLGMTFDQVAYLMLSYNAFCAIHCDGGYSSDMCIEGPGGGPQTIGIPANNNIPGSVSPVGQLFGVYWE